MLYNNCNPRVIGAMQSAIHQSLMHLFIYQGCGTGTGADGANDRFGDAFEGFGMFLC